VEIVDGISENHCLPISLENRREQEKGMPTIMPEGERIRQAVKFISAERMEDEKKSLRMLIQKASLKFNLSPKEEQDLVNFYREK